MALTTMALARIDFTLFFKCSVLITCGSSSYRLECGGFSDLFNSLRKGGTK